MTRMTRRWGAVAVGALLLAAPAAAGAAVAPQDGRAAEVVRRVNLLRDRRGLSHLRVSAALTRAGERYAAQVVKDGHWSHEGADGSTVADRAETAGWRPGDGPWGLGEALAWGSGDLAGPAAAVGAWLDSPPHRRLLLDPRWREIGVGAAAGSPNGSRWSGTTYALELGRR
jgi:uncharacterized protein YkwD